MSPWCSSIFICHLTRAVTKPWWLLTSPHIPNGTTATAATSPTVCPPDDCHAFPLVSLLHSDPLLVHSPHPSQALSLIQ